MLIKKSYWKPVGFEKIKELHGLASLGSKADEELFSENQSYFEPLTFVKLRGLLNLLTFLTFYLHCNLVFRRCLPTFSLIRGSKFLIDKFKNQMKRFRIQLLLN